MIDLLNLSLPYFGLIFIGFVCGKARNLPESGLAWLNFLLLYIALPALFFPHPGQDAVRAAEQSAVRDRHHLRDASAYLLACALTFVMRRRPRDAVMAGLAGSFGNIGYRDLRLRASVHPQPLRLR